MYIAPQARTTLATWSPKSAALGPNLHVCSLSKLCMSQTTRLLDGKSRGYFIARRERDLSDNPYIAVEIYHFYHRHSSEMGRDTSHHSAMLSYPALTWLLCSVAVSSKCGRHDSPKKCGPAALVMNAQSRCSAPDSRYWAEKVPSSLRSGQTRSSPPPLRSSSPPALRR